MAESILAYVRQCSKCGTTNRDKYGACIGCKRASNAALYAANREKIKAATNAWRAANPDKVKAILVTRYAKNSEKLKAAATVWNTANPEKVKASGAAWKAANPEALVVFAQNRRSRKNKSKGRLSRGLSRKLFELQKGKCPCCSLPLGDDYHMDHRMPLMLGGSNTDENMQLLRATCNLQKHAKHPIDFMRERGFLI